MAHDESEDIKAAPNVFISRVDSYFGRILSQYLGTTVHGELGGSEEDKTENTAPPDVAFLHEKSPENASSITATWRPLPTQDSVQEPPETLSVPLLPAVRSLLRSDNDLDNEKAIEAAEICIFSVFEDNGANHILTDAAGLLKMAVKVALTKKLRKTLILLSTTMTWGSTKKPGSEEEKFEKPEPDQPEPQPQGEEEEEEEEGLMEENYRKRRPHPSYRNHLEFEKDFLKYGRDSKGLLTTTVIGVGVVYGLGEDVLHWMFKDAWEGEIPVRLVGTGRIYVPMIHARDLCQVVQNVCDAKPKRRYIVGMDGGNLKLNKIAEAISLKLGAGAVDNLDPEILLSDGTIGQREYDLLTTNVHLAAGTIKEEMKINWSCENGLVEGLPMVIQEYRTIRRLTPVKVIVIGPPFSGKTLLGKRISEHYKVHYLDVTEVVDDALADLHALVEEGKKRFDIPEGEEEPEFTEAEEEERAKWEISKELSLKVEESEDANNGKVSDTFVIQFMREKLLSIPCQNQGFVLDNFPDNYGHATGLFGSAAGSEEEDGDPESDEVTVSAEIFPDFVFYLDAPEDVLRQRVMTRPDVPGPTTATTTEEIYRKRMDDYNASSPMYENSVVRYFDEKLHAVHSLDLSKDSDSGMDITLQTAITIVGESHNYGPTKQEKMKEAKAKEEAVNVKINEEKQIKDMYEKQNFSNRQRRCNEWLNRTNGIRQERQQQVIRGTLPVQDFLAKNVLPAVNDGMLAIIKARPKNPVDFLGNYLIQLKNPQNQEPPLSASKKLVRVAKG